MSAGEGPSERTPAHSEEEESLLTRFRTDESGPLMFIRELLTSMATVALVGLLLFAISGVWPPMVAVESGSMDPNMQKGDLIFVTDPGRYMPEYDYAETGVVTYRTGADHDYRTFNDYGSVIVFKNPSTFGPPIIHRARFWVDDGENWYEQANKTYMNAESCSELRNCPAPHAGFITKGDNNPYYDQAYGISSPVKESWLVGTARLRIPYLGWVRLGFSGAATTTPVLPGTASAAMTSSAAPVTPALPAGPVPPNPSISGGIEQLNGPTATSVGTASPIHQRSLQNEPLPRQPAIVADGAPVAA